MKKFIQGIMIVFASIVLLVGCSSSEESEIENGTDQSDEGTVVIIVSEEEADEVYSEKEIAIDEDEILMDVMKENYDIDEEEGFINSIDGIAPEEGEEKAWIYSVNGEDAMVGAAEYELSFDDEVVFDLQSWE